MEIISCRGITKRYGKGENQVRALDGIDLSVGQGESVALAGPSGSGKSSLLHILGAMDQATSGTAIVNGIELSHLSHAKAALFRRRNVALIYQFYNLSPALTADQNIHMPLLLDKQKPDLG